MKKESSKERKGFGTGSDFVFILLTLQRERKNDVLCLFGVPMKNALRRKK